MSMLHPAQTQTVTPRSVAPGAVLAARLLAAEIIAAADRMQATGGSPAADAAALRHFAQVLTAD